MKFTPSQVIEMRKAADDYAEAQSSDLLEISEISDERFATLAADRALEAAAVECDVTPPQPFRPSIEAAHAIRAMKEQA